MKFSDILESIYCEEGVLLDEGVNVRPSTSLRKALTNLLKGEFLPVVGDIFTKRVLKDRTLGVRNASFATYDRIGTYQLVATVNSEIGGSLYSLTVALYWDLDQPHKWVMSAWHSRDPHKIIEETYNIEVTTAGVLAGQMHKAVGRLAEDLATE